MEPLQQNRQPMQQNRQQQNVIDLEKLMTMFLRRFWVILFSGILVGLCALAYVKVTVRPVYTSSTKIYVLNKGENVSDVTSSDLQLGATLATDYAQLIKDRTVAEGVISELGLSMSADTLISKIDVTMPNSGRIITISVSDPDPYLASKLATTVRDVAAEHIKDVMNSEAVNVVEDANIPQGQSMNNYKKYGQMGFMAGVVLAMGLIFLQYMMNDTITDEKDVEKFLNIGALGSIPLVKENGRKEKKEKVAHQATPEQSIAKVKRREEPQSYESSEAYKSLRTNLQFCGTDKQIIVFTSCAPDEGKSTVVLNLATSLAEAEKKVLVLDADLRKSVMAARFQIEGEYKGMTHYLSGMCDLEEAINPTNQKNLDIIFAGPYPPNPSELLSGSRFHELLETAKKQYDYILIDCAPLGNVIDSAVVAKECDGSVIVVEAGVISYRFTQEIKMQLEKSGCPVLGVILNKTDIREKKYYNHYYGKKYGKYYGKYYGK